jgi:hypothetical protein
MISKGVTYQVPMMYRNQTASKRCRFWVIRDTVEPAASSAMSVVLAAQDHCDRKPPLGIGLTEKVDVERSEVDKSDLRDQATETEASD